VTQRNVVAQWLRWFFKPSGIVVAEEKGRISWARALVMLFTGGVRRSPDGPNAAERSKMLMIHRPLKRYKCRVCGTYVWAWKKTDVCYHFSCFRKAGK